VRFALLLLSAAAGCSRTGGLPDDPNPPHAGTGIPSAAVSARLDLPSSSVASATADPLPSSGFGGSKPIGPVPRIRGDTPVLSNAGLPPEVVQRIIRQNFGRFRLCYEKSAALDPTLEGAVVVTFHVDAAGDVSAVTDAGSTVGSPGLVACVLRGFGGLSFPSPSTAGLDVTQTLTFTPRSP
jgi:hypothetical protein